MSLADPNVMGRPDAGMRPQQRFGHVFHSAEMTQFMTRRDKLCRTRRPSPDRDLVEHPARCGPQHVLSINEVAKSGIFVEEPAHQNFDVTRLH